jgi:hypothetical protein
MINLKKKKSYTLSHVADILGVTHNRVNQMVMQDSNPNRRKTHFPGIYWCECGKCLLVPASDITNILNKRAKKHFNFKKPQNRPKKAK